MKSVPLSIKYLVMLSLFVLFSPAMARPVLVAVDLPDRVRIDLWRAMNYPTYAFFEQVAFAEIERDNIGDLERPGFSFQIIDEEPWTGNYFLVRPDQDARLDAWRIWSRRGLALVKLSTAETGALLQVVPQPFPVRRNPLSARFWDAQTRTTVYLPVPWDPFIQGLVNQVNTDSLVSYVTRLQQFQTRLSYSDSGFAASEWVRQKFNSFGYQAAFDSFYLYQTWWGVWPDTGYERNVVARSTGQYHPGLEFIVCGHFDSFLFPDTPQARTFAPGADDNGSGTASALEIARIFQGYPWDATLRYISFACEEMGLMGSGYDAYMADSQGREIGGVINLDMVGYMDDAVYDVRIQRIDSSGLWITRLFRTAAHLYVPTLTVVEVTANGGSDWYPYAQRGFPAGGCAENQGTQYNPNWHQVTDVIGSMDPALHVMSTKSCLAAMAILGVYPRIVANPSVRNLGDGTQLLVTWTPITGADITGYRVYWGNSSQAYTDSLIIDAPGIGCDTISGLTPDSTYCVAVAAIDNANRRSYAAIEISATLKSVPGAPAGIMATPQDHAIRIDWQPNEELDLAGYRIYRRLNDEPAYDSLNIGLLNDTTHEDLGLSGADRYYYALRAFDFQGNCSPYSAEVYSRPITLDQGVLLVDETRNGTNPPDSLQDQFYAYILQDYRVTAYDYGATNLKPAFVEFLPFSSVVWFADDYTEKMASGSTDDLKRYLDLGGNLWFAGWRPVSNLNNNPVYPMVFEPGDFIYDYLKVSRAEQTGANDSFQTARGRLGYPDCAVDTARIPIPSWNKTLRYIEAYDLWSGEANYTIGLKNSGSPYENDTCGARSLGGTYRTVLSGFPVYFMDREQARLLARKVMADLGELPVMESSQNIKPILSGLRLTLAPNPFTRRALIDYQIPITTAVRISIYNSIGRLVKRLVNRVEPAGRRRIEWLGDDQLGNPLPNGVYFVRVDGEDGSAVQKVTLLR